MFFLNTFMDKFLIPVTSAQQRMLHGALAPLSAINTEKPHPAVCVLSSSDAAPGMKVEAVCGEEPLGPLAAALRALRAAMTDPTQHDGEDAAVRRAVRAGCWRDERVSGCGQGSVAVVVKPGHSAGGCRARGLLSHGMGRGVGLSFRLSQTLNRIEYSAV